MPESPTIPRSPKRPALRRATWACAISGPPHPTRRPPAGPRPAVRRAGASSRANRPASSPCRALPCPCRRSARRPCAVDLPYPCARPTRQSTPRPRQSSQQAPLPAGPTERPANRPRAVPRPQSPQTQLLRPAWPGWPPACCRVNRADPARGPSGQRPAPRSHTRQARSPRAHATRAAFARRSNGPPESTPGRDQPPPAPPVPGGPVSTPVRPANPAPQTSPMPRTPWPKPASSTRAWKVRPRPGNSKALTARQSSAARDWSIPGASGDVHTGPRKTVRT